MTSIPSGPKIGTTLWVVRALCLAAGMVSAVLWYRATNRQDSGEVLFWLWVSALVSWGAAFFSRWRVSAPSKDALWLLGIVVLAIIPRAVSLPDLPYGVAGDETIYPVQGQRLLQEFPWNVFGQKGSLGGVPNLIVVLCAWPCLFMDPLLGARLAAVLLGVGSLVTTYFLARQLFDRTVALVASAMLGAWYWHIVFSRVSYPTIQPPFFAPLALFAGVVALERGNRFLQLLAGMTFGLAVLVYTPTRITLSVFGLWVLHRQLVRRPPVIPVISALSIMGLGLLLFTAPYLSDAGLFAPFQRLWETSLAGAGPLRRIQNTGWNTSEGREILVQQVGAAAQVYFVGRGAFSPHDMAPGPLLDRVSLVCIALSLGHALLTLRHGGRWLLLSWIGLTFVVAQVLTDLPEGAHRAGVMLPALGIAAADGLVSLCRFASRRMRRRSDTSVRVLSLALIVLVIWPFNYAYLSAFFVGRSHDPVTPLARLVRSGPPDAIHYLLSSQRLADSYLMQFLGGRRERRDVLSLMDALGQKFDVTRDAVLVMDPLLVPALSAIRRCYPGAYVSKAEGGAQALLISRESLQHGQGCRLGGTDSGLRARYFAAFDWSGEVVLDRFEDWPARFEYDLERVQSAEWTGFLRVPVPGTYVFQTVLADAEGNTTIGNAVIPSHPLPVRFHRGNLEVPLSLRCRPLVSTGFCWLRWEPPGGRFEAIAPDFFRPSTARE